ncbi:unnamed protein product [Arabis nemorensis]|uniref:3'-5' exonuclease domain-containing protein n=1 Tax=Arabis nemorensis TaxID=586526 RepID=A0A565AS60_9BRAS|nr:unnamed protein product [Arabis nemorensis]
MSSSSNASHSIEESRDFAAMNFDGRILYSKTASEVDKRTMQHLQVLETKRDDSGKAIVGFDIEWRPSFRKGVLPNKVAVIHICVDNDYCDVMHIIHSGIPQRLKHLIEDSTLIKVGIGIEGDSVKLFHDHGVSIHQRCRGSFRFSQPKTWRFQTMGSCLAN